MKKLALILLVTAVAGTGVYFFLEQGSGDNGDLYIIEASRGDIEVSVTAYGVVRPRNRLEIKPPFAGRIEDILVSEGDTVEAGEVMAWMSSQDRAALLDIARSRGEDEVARWSDVYRRAPIVAHLSGFVIRRGAEPGQSVSSGEAVIVMADELILRAQVDETDIGKIRTGYPASIRLDAYPGRPFRGEIEHIAYESETVSNVVVYNVDIRPLDEFELMRSGMSAEVEITLNRSDDTVYLPLSAIRGGREPFVIVNKGNSLTERRPVETGITDGINVEITSGLTEGEKVVYDASGYISDRRAERARSRGGLPGMGGN